LAGYLCLDLLGKLALIPKLVAGLRGHVKEEERRVESGEREGS